jgi:hypothetical protein
MKTNKIIKQNDLLLKVRQEQIENPVVGSLRSHGKLWGMDVFSWFKPNLFELENTISSFPFPIVWFSNEDDVLNLINDNTTWVSNVKLICTYDKAGFKLSNKLLDKIENVLGSASLTDALELLKVLKVKQSVFLFTSSSENWKEVKEEFDNYLSLNQ